MERIFIVGRSIASGVINCASEANLPPTSEVVEESWVSDRLRLWLGDGLRVGCLLCHGDGADGDGTAVFLCAIFHLELSFEHLAFGAHDFPHGGGGPTNDFGRLITIDIDDRDFKLLNLLEEVLHREHFKVGI